MPHVEHGVEREQTPYEGRAIKKAPRQQRSAARERPHTDAIAVDAEIVGVAPHVPDRRLHIRLGDRIVGRRVETVIDYHPDEP